MADELNNTSGEELRAWLQDKPREWARVIALRAALRVLPLAIDPKNWQKQLDQRLIFAVFRAMAVSSAAAKIPADDTDAAAYAAYAYAAAYAADDADAAAAAADAAAYAAAAAAYAAYAAAADTVAAAAYADAAAYAAAAAAYSADAASTSWEAVLGDCRVLESSDRPDTLMRLHLWPSAPDWWSEAWEAARKWLAAGSEALWPIWADWYEARIRGEVAAFSFLDSDGDLKFNRWLIDRDDDWWKREPAEVNADIKAYVDGLRKIRAPTDSQLQQTPTVINYLIDEDGTTQIAPEPMPNGVQDDQDTQDNYGEIKRLIAEALRECDPTRTQDKAMAPVTQLVLDGMGENLSQLRPRLFILRSKELVRRYEEKKSGDAMTPLSQGQSDAFAPLVDAIQTLAEFDSKLAQFWAGRRDGETQLTREQLELIVLALAEVKQMSPEAQLTVETYVAQVDKEAEPDDPALKQANDGVGNAVKAMGKAVRKSDDALKSADRALRVAEKGGKMWDKLHDKLPGGDTITRIIEWMSNLPGGGTG